MASLSHRLGANKRFDFASKAFGEDKFAVVAMQGHESISQPFRFELTLVTDDADIDFDAILAQPATFNIFAPDGKAATPYHGMLAEFDQLHQADGYVFYRALLVPRLWQLTLYQVSEVYLDEQAIPALLKNVLEKAHFSSLDVELKTSGSYRPRSFVCQYQESHLDFLSRWMEKEGMYYWFEHGDHDKLVIADSKSMHSATAVAVNYRPADQLDTGTAPDSVQSFTCRQKPLPRQVILQDTNHRNAATQLRATAPVADRGIGEVMFYGENFRDNQEGERYARLRAEEILCGARVFSGESTAVGLRSGFFLELAQHYRQGFNGRYLVTDIEHRGSQAGALLNGIRSPLAQGGDQGSTGTSYENSFRAIAADVQFRPERLTQKPRVAGTMNAVIDSEGSGEYAELDEFGQYKVQLPFKQTDKKANHGSARVRMATPYAGNNHGMHFPLHKNAEVLLSFTDGDPDRPVIVGAVPNSENVSAVDSSNHAQSRITSAGGNHVFMDDTRGREMLALSTPNGGSTTVMGQFGSEAASKGIWESTAGASISLTAGATTSVTAGLKNAVTVGFDNSMSAASATKFNLGTSTSFSVGQDVAWKFGRGITLDSSETVSLKTDGKLQANETVTISGGQRAVIKTLVETMKSRVRLAVGMNALANIAVVSTAAGMLAKEADDKGGKVAAWTPVSNKVSSIVSATSGVAMMTSHLLLDSAARAIATAVAKSPAYASNIKVNGDGIDISAEDILPTHKTTLKVAHGGMSVKSTTLGSASFDLKPGEIKMVSNDTYQTARATINDAGVDLFTKFGAIKLGRDNGAEMKMELSGITMKSSSSIASSVKLSGDGASMLFNDKNGFSAKALSVKAVCDNVKMELSPMSASLSAGGPTLSVGSSGATVNGAMIRLG